jgi:hypothetical protein
VGIDPDDADPGRWAVCLLDAGEHADGGGIVSSQDQDRAAVPPSLGHQGGGVRADFADVDRGAAFLTVFGPEVSLMRPLWLEAPVAQPLHQSGRQDRVRPGAETILPLIVTIRNGHHPKTHQPTPLREPCNLGRCYATLALLDCQY